MRVGSAVYVLPLANSPLRIAEEVATLDQISGGRFDFGIGRSGFERSYRAYGIDYGESQARFDEALDILRRAWAGGKFSYEGKYYKVTDAEVMPAPVQKPGPPMRMAATSAATFEKVAREGLPVFVGLRGDGLSFLAGSLGNYRSAWKANGHPGEGSAYLRVPAYVGADERDGYDTPRAGIEYYFARQARMLTARHETGREGIAEALAALDYDEIRASRVAFGSAEQVIDRFKEFRDVLGIDGFVLELNAGGMLSADAVKASLDRLCHDVMPAFR
jgi:alkanesulfonate monooxygenase SsuD/methylene tetrahydromethanopterin reductase-like flavin-dependent oxidoreductase (luciferase family)